jgi:uncharacterized repeat protein (TIGR03803 family)
MHWRRGHTAALAFAVLIGVCTAAAAQESVLYRFKGGRDGATPVAGLLMDASGTLYGTTLDGGTGCSFLGCGTVFALTRPAAGASRWTEQVLHRFTGGNDGAFPDSGLIMDANGVLYGTTGYGGKNGCFGTSGCGTVFALTPGSGGTRTPLKLLYQFHDGSDGATPEGGLIIGAHGVLYGSTLAGGRANSGTVFALTPPAPGKTRWTEQVLYRLPSSALLMEGVRLYGTIEGGGSHGFGTVFALAPPAAGGTNWTETVLYSFKGGTDGAYPMGGLIMDAGGALYGTTFGGANRVVCGGAGCGTVFKLAPPAAGGKQWTETVLHRFGADGDGVAPFAGLIVGVSGDLYGTTRYGGTGCHFVGCGTVFELSPPAAGGNVWTETVLYRFRGGGDGVAPFAGLIADRHGVLYGTTMSGGPGCSFNSPSGCGTVFKVVP